ncbi:hypothetical protein HDV05_007882 [Chytridiales sp. JEL 0842]|nr:hypothetical protein HDV05_007882 [Chytridiales sp. JEL 0842]
MSTSKTFTWAEIEQSALKKRTPADILADPDAPVYIVINDKVYNVGGDFIKWHPGGAVVLTQLGKDATGAFAVFHSANAESILSEYYVGDLAESEIREKSELDKAFDDLRSQMVQMKAYDSSKLYYLFKVLSNVAIGASAIYILYHYGRTSIPMVLLSGFLMALFWQQCGWLAHDFLHHQVFENRIYNDMVGYIVGNCWLGFSVSWWKNKHCTHHAACNVHDVDPDINTMPYLAWSEHALELFTDVDDAAVAKFLVKYQPILFFPLLAFGRMAWCLASARFCYNDLLMSKTRKVVELTLLSTHWLALLGLLVAFCTPLNAIIFFASAQLFGGLLLAVVFSVNHNGMPVLTKAATKALNFYELQIITGRNVNPGLFNNWFSGGLNYQIEHHVFPMIPRHQFHRVQPLVEELCRKHKVSYHKTSLWGGLVEVVGRLASVSRAAEKVVQQKKQE